MQYQAANFPIGGREAYLGLLWKYSLLAVYASGSFFLGATTVGYATGPAYAKLFPVFLFLACIMAFVGVIVSRWTARVWIEYAGTIFLLAGMVGYAIAIAYVALGVYGDLGRLPAAVLPIVLMVFPILRLRNILKTVAQWKAARRPQEEGADA